MSDYKEKTEDTSNVSSSWKFWLGCMMFIALIIQTHREKNSVEHKVHIEQYKSNLARNYYHETYDSCMEANYSSSYCQEEAKQEQKAMKNGLDTFTR